MTDILNCPFCGGIAESFIKRAGSGHGESYDKAGIRCLNRECQAEISIADYSGEAIEKRKLMSLNQWNTRAHNIEALLSVYDAAIKAHDAFYTITIDYEETAPNNIKNAHSKIVELQRALLEVNNQGG